MSIRYECEECGSVLKIKDDLAGKPGKCPKCKTAFTVPALEEATGSSGETAAVESEGKAEPTLAAPKTGNANDDFDLDAFLLDDGKSNPETTQARLSKQHDDDQQLGDEDDESGRHSKGTGIQNADEGFSIRRGPDAPDSRLKQPAMSSSEDDEVDESPSSTRRPPGTNPNAPASNIASDLLSMSAKKGKKTPWNELASEKPTEDEFDWEGFRREVLKKVVPIVVVGILLCWGLFRVVNSAMGPKTFVPPLGQVTGTLTINAQPLVGAEIWFYPEKDTIIVDDKKHKVTASQGRTDAAGRYELTYVGELKGAVVGTCRVQIVAAGRQDVAPQYLGYNATATQKVKKGKQIIDLELSK